MVGGQGASPGKGGQCGVRVIRRRVDFAAREGAERAAPGKVSHRPLAGPQHRPFFRLAQEILPDQGRCPRVGRLQGHPAPAFWPQHDDAEGKTIGVAVETWMQIGPGGQRRGVDQQLQVGQCLGGVGFQEPHQPAWHIARDAVAEQICPGHVGGDPVVAHSGEQRAGLLATVAHDRREMILQIAADAAQGNPRFDPERPQIVRIADARKLQQLRRLDHAGGEDHRTCHGGPLLALVLITNAGDAVAVEQQPLHLRLHLDGKVAAGQRRPQVRNRIAAAPALADRQLHPTETVLTSAVIIIGPGMAGRAGGVPDALDQRVGVFRGDGGQRAAGAAIRIRPALPILLAAEIRQHLLVRPFAKASLRPALIISGVAAHVGHRVGRGTTAHDLAARTLDDAVVERRFGGGGKAPVMQLLGVDLAPAERYRDQRITIPAAGFQQQHPGVRVFRQPRRQHATGRTGADDDVVVVRRLRQLLILV